VDGWIAFWKIASTVGFVSFYILVLVVVPLGARDLFRLFRHLSRGSDRPPDAEVPR